jgi:hypothetical protein
MADRVEAHFWVEQSAGDSITYYQAGNISRGGIKLESPLPLQVGAVAMLEFTLPGDERPIRCGGEVRDATDGERPGMHIEFFEISPEDAARIDTFVEGLDVPDPDQLHD